MVIANMNESVCARCHRLGQGCCSSFHNGLPDASRIFPLLPVEMDRMVKASCLQLDDFTVQDEISAEFGKILLELNPVLAAAAPAGKRRRLKLQNNGDCIFLGGHGCRLPLTDRPYYCKLYPFWFLRDGRMFVLLHSACLAQNQAAGWQQVLTRLAMNEVEVRAMFNEYMQELGKISPALS
jgi:Fe-S-cluster containining protein